MSQRIGQAALPDGGVLDGAGGAQLAGDDVMAAAEVGELNEEVGARVEAADEATGAGRFGDDHGKLYNRSQAAIQCG